MVRAFWKTSLREPLSGTSPPPTPIPTPPCPSRWSTRTPPVFPSTPTEPCVPSPHFDYETNSSSYVISVRVTDEHNASLDGNFTVTLLNQVEDLDGDGVEDHYDPDDDGDGFSDATEIAYGSDPRDPNSVANAAPNSLELNGSTILENQPAGTIIGRLSGTDPDANATLSFSLVDGNASGLSLDANGTLRALVSLDFETNANSHGISVRVTDEHNASLDGNFTITLLNEVEDLDGDGIEDHYDSDSDGDGFSDATEIDYGSDPRDPNSVANAAPNSLELNGTSILENQPVGTLVGQLYATDPDANSSLSFTLVPGKGSEDNHLFLPRRRQTSHPRYLRLRSKRRTSSVRLVSPRVQRHSARSSGIPE